MELRNHVSSENNHESNKATITDDIIESTIKSLKENNKESKENIHKGHRSRLKNQFIESGFSSLSDIQKLELLLYFAIPQKDTNPIAHNLLNYFGSIKNIFSANHLELMKVDGIKDNSALLINLVNAFNNYCAKPDDGDGYILNSSETTLEYVKKLFHGVDIEQFYVICLTKQGSIKKCSLISTGSIDQVDVQIRTITQLAIENKVNRIIICHNHPAGTSRASDDDIKLTFSIMCSCILNSIDLLDHIIIGKTDELSLYEAGYIEKLKQKAYNTIKLSTEQQLFLSSSSSDYKKSKVVHIDIENAI